MSSKIKYQKTKSKRFMTKRGDTIIEVMFAIAVFSLVAVLTISMMNLGTANAEGALELTTARHELNAQAEALRFVHSAYTAELALPSCSTPVLQKGEKCQRYKDLWEEITRLAREHRSDDVAQQAIIDLSNTLNNNDSSIQNTYGNTIGCRRAYESVNEFGGSSLLVKNNAFVLNVRDLNIAVKNDNTGLESPTRALLRATNTNSKFVPTSLSARIVYHATNDSSQTTDDGFAVRTFYNQISQVEGLWVVAIKGEGVPTPFYDFYIQTCWNAPNSLSPTILDTVIRLYNPGAK